MIDKKGGGNYSTFQTGMAEEANLKHRDIMKCSGLSHEGITMIPVVGLRELVTDFTLIT